VPSVLGYAIVAATRSIPASSSVKRAFAALPRIQEPASSGALGWRQGRGFAEFARIPEY